MKEHKKSAIKLWPVWNVEPLTRKEYHHESIFLLLGCEKKSILIYAIIIVTLQAIADQLLVSTITYLLLFFFKSFTKGLSVIRYLFILFTTGIPFSRHPDK